MFGPADPARPSHLAGDCLSLAYPAKRVRQTTCITEGWLPIVAYMNIEPSEVTYCVVSVAGMYGGGWTFWTSLSRWGREIRGAVHALSKLYKNIASVY